MIVDLIQDFMWGSKIMETLWIILINIIITFIVGAWLFRYFDFVFNTQADLIDDLLQLIQNKQEPTELLTSPNSEEE